jgi:hypothetical protein
MTPTFRIQSLISGAYAAPIPARVPFVACEHSAAVYDLAEAMRRAEELFVLTGERCRLVGSALEWDFDQSVDFLPH